MTKAQQHPLERHLRRGELGATDAEALILFEAGQRYAALCEAATDRVGTASLEPRVSGGAPDSTVFHSAKERLRNTDARLGRTFARGLKIVVVNGHSVKEWARIEGEEGNGAGLVLLRSALRELVRTWVA